MTKSWPLLALAVLGAVAAVFCLAAFDWTAWACRLPPGEEGKVLTPGVGGCAEYWLNRYQALIGALVAIGAAAFAWRGVVMQVASAEKQVRIGRRQSAIALIEVLNSNFDNVRGLSREIRLINQRDKDAKHYRKVAIRILGKMRENISDPRLVRDIYADNYELAMRGHSTCVAAMKQSIAGAAELINLALVSSDTKEQIWQLINNARHSLWTHEMAAEGILAIPSIFDETTNKTKASRTERLYESIAKITFFPPLESHPGFELAVEASKNMGELLDSALQDAEGRPN